MSAAESVSRAGLTSKKRHGDKAAVVPGADVRTYYDRPVIKPPVWTFEVPWYFFFGGMSGGSSMLVGVADATDRPELARAARRVAAAGAIASPVLLIKDLGMPSRFANMLRVFRPTSPLNMGSWLLSVYAPAAVGAALLDGLERGTRLRRLADAGAAVGALGMTTYTAVLISDTAVPAWHEARRELPFVFAGTAGASAGAAALVLTGDGAGVTRRLVVLSTAMGQIATKAMERRLGPLGDPYHEGSAGRYTRTARVLTTAGAAVVALTGRRRRGAVAGGAMVLAGAVCERWGIFEAGFQSAEDPAATIGPQRERVSERQRQERTADH